MGDVVQLASNSTGLSPVFLVRDFDGDVWSTVGSAFETYQTANRANYEIAMTEQDVASRYYEGTFPAAITSGSYNVEMREAAGESQNLAGVLRVDWDGSNIIELSTELAGIATAVWDALRANHTVVGSFGEGVKVSADGIDNVSTTEPAGVPGNFNEQMNWLYARFANRTALTSLALQVFNANSTTIMTTQLTTDNGTVQELAKVI